MEGPDEASIMAELHYVDPEAALDWLARAFGFATRIVVRDDQNRLVYSESGFGDCTVAVLPELGDKNRSPRRLEDVNTQSVRMRTSMDVRLHCDRARTAGAKILQEPEQFFFGDLTYFVADLEGHIWSFAQPIPGEARRPPEGWTVSFPST